MIDLSFLNDQPDNHQALILNQQQLIQNFTFPLLKNVYPLFFYLFISIIATHSQVPSYNQPLPTMLPTE